MKEENLSPVSGAGYLSFYGFGKKRSAFIS
jgi:hypothetical protein